MARPLRIEFPGAIYHVTSRGNARQKIFADERDYQRMRDGLAQTVQRHGWEFFAFALMPNHVHLFFRTPEPNLSRGMQYLLSGYANWHSKRHQRPGHLFQGRFKAKLVEDESYYWELSRYIHLNPVRGKRPLVKHPREWPFSSYPGYVQKRHRLDWISYNTVFAAWQGEMGGKNAENAYRRYVEAGLASPIEDPFLNSPYDWLLGSNAFVEKLRSCMERPQFEDEMPTARKLAALSPERVLVAVAVYYGVDVSDFRRKRNGHISREVAAWLARRLSTATMRELAGAFGLTNPTSLSNLTRRVDQKLKTSAKLRAEIKTLRDQLLKTKNEV
jgi:REP element-mobilizing transposase RayT